MLVICHSIYSTLTKATLFQGTCLINQSSISTIWVIFVANFPDASVRMTPRAAQQLPGPIQLDKDINYTHMHTFRGPVFGPIIRISTFIIKCST